MGLPLIALGLSAVRAVMGGNVALMTRMLPPALWDTGLLMAQVGVATALLGLFSAWLVTHYDFAGRRIFDWALMLPLAVPTYLSAYAWVEFLDFTGPVQGAVRALTGAASARDYWFPDIRSPGGAAFVMSLVLYPYVYMACRAFFLMQSGAVVSAARTLGAGGARSFLSVVLPLSRPAVVVGVTLALMEVVNDLGAVQYFGVRSLTAVIYATWINRGDFAGAAELAVTIVLIIGLLIWLERRARRQGRSLTGRDTRTPPPLIRLGRSRAALAFLFCLSLFGLGFGVPFGELLTLSLARLTGSGLPPSLLPALWHTISLGLFGAALAVTLGLFTARRMHGTGRIGRMLLRLSTLGYALPGTVLALGLTVPLGLFDGWLNAITRSAFGLTVGLVFTGSLAAIAYAYAIRFLAVSHSTLEAAIEKRGDTMLDAARVLGARRREILFKIDLPTLSPALVAAATLVFVECVKELPATLLLRPLGVETLATLVYAEASAELFPAAALPALFIVIAGLVPVLIATRITGGVRDTRMG